MLPKPGQRMLTLHHIAALVKSVQAEAAQPLDGDGQIALQRRLESRIADSASHHVLYLDGGDKGGKGWFAFRPMGGEWGC